ncbi:MAG: hypothetical protein LBV06_07030 [Propionibacteriaceae bacterium]|nr:hypothetical protein [Propionibacteriaceae bacterium]
MPSPSKIKFNPFDNRRWMAEQIVNGIDASEFLATITDRQQWRSEAVKLGEKALGYAAERGRECHRIMEALVNGQPASVGDPQVVTDPVLSARLRVDPTIERDAQCAAKALEAFRVQPIMTEQPVINTTWWYSGSCDLVATCPVFGDDQPTIVDYKFTKSVSDEYALQQSAYNHVTNTLVRVQNRGPRGGTLPDTWEFGDMSDVRQDRAYILNTTDGYSSMVPMTTDGEVWKAVQAWVVAYWAFLDTNPVGGPVQPVDSPADESAPF